MDLGKLVPVVAAVAFISAVAAGCGGTSQNGAEPPLVAKGPVKGALTIAQWPLYVDPGKHGTVANLQRSSGDSVKWVEEINDNVQFFGKIRPQLANGQSGGRSMITVSDCRAAQMYQLGYLQRLDYSQLPNVTKNLIPALRHPSADPQRKFTVPWQSGMTGLIVRTDKAPNVTSINDLYNPKHKGQVTMLTEMRDSVPMTLKGVVIDADNATTAQWLSPVDQIKTGAPPSQTLSLTDAACNK